MISETKQSSIDGLSPAKRDLVQRLLRGEMEGEVSTRLRNFGFVSSPPQLQHDHAARFEKFPLTEMQQAYWVGRQRSLELGNVAIHSYLEIHLNALDVARLQRAWNRIIQRHDMLRAVILPDGYQQVLTRVNEYQIQVISCATRSECDAAKVQLRERMSHEVFDMQNWPPFSLAVTEGAGEAVLHISVDGALIDAWSLSTVIRECLELYQGPEICLPDLEITFRDYVMAERAVRNQPAYQASLAWWRQRLEKLPGPPDLPLMKQPRLLRNPKFVRRVGGLEAVKWHALRQAAGLRGITPPCLLLTLYAHVLSFWVANRQFTLNVPRFDRRAVHPQLDDLVGEFASFTLLACDTSGPATLLEKAQRLQSQMWELLEHRDVSGLTVIRELIRLRGRGSASFPVVFTGNPSLGAHKPRALPAVLPGQIDYAITQTPQVWLDFQIGERDGCLSFNWDAVDELFPPGMLDELNSSFSRLLDTISQDESLWGNALL